MKKALLATTALVMSAGIAAADVTISGYGRTGVVHYEDGAFGWHGFTTPDADPGAAIDAKDTQIVSRLRMNIDATTETDAGVEFGGRLRLQWDQNHGSRGASASTNAGKLWISAQGLTVEMGNVESALETTKLFYASELGAFDRSVGGNMIGSFFAYDASPYTTGRVGVGAIYSFGDVNVRASYIDPDQTQDLAASVPGGNGAAMAAIERDEELSIGIDYTWNERLELAAAAVKSGGGWDGNDLFFVGARYAVLDNAHVGLNYYDNGDVIGGGMHGIRAAAEMGATYDLGSTVTLYGDYTLADGLTNIEAYVANNDGDWVAKETDNAFGIGVNYDLGGARLGASVQRDYQERTSADMGVRFEF